MARSAAALRIAVLVLASSAPGAGPCQAQTGRVVDLGHPLSTSDPSWSGKPVFERTGTAQMGRLASDEHFGTHVDAPVHFGGRWSVDQIPVDRFVRPGVCINVAGAPEDYRISTADVKAWEAKHGPIPEGAIVLFATGWDARWPDARTYMNERGGVKHFPGIAPEVATYLSGRKIAGMGIDTPSVDYGPSEKYETHNVTNPAGIYHVENATNLTKLPARGFTVVVAPINIAGGSGGPARVFALLP